MNLTIRELGREDTDTFERVLEIYRASIEPSEQRLEDELRALPGREDYLVLAAERDGAITGFSIAWLPEAEDFWLFEYCAVSPDERGKGTGIALFRRTAAVADPRNVGLIEADTARDAVGARRLKFYARLGCRLIDGVDYKLPLRVAGEPPPMLLLAAPFHGLVSHLGLDVIERALRRIYESVYGQSPDDPRIAAMIDGLPVNVPLTSLDPARP